MVSMFLLWTQEDRDMWMKLHYPTTGSVDGNGWSGTILRQRLANLWFLFYAGTAVLTPWLDRLLHRRLGVALRALLLVVAAGATVHAILLLRLANSSDRVMIGPGGWLGLAGVGACLGAGWIEMADRARLSTILPTVE
jgi:hypothetical protein